MDIPTRFGSTHLVVCGPKDGPPLVLLHSFFMSLTVWAYNIADFSRDHRVYALDMIGQPGKSIPNQPMRNRGEMAEWLTAILDGLGVGQTDLIGWSYGGFATLNYAILRPDRLRRLILIIPIGSFVSYRRQFYIRAMLTRLPGRFWSNSMMHWFTYRPNLSNKDTRRFFDTVTDQFYAGVRYFRLPPTVLPAPFADEELRGVRSPTLLLIGQQEALYDPVTAIERAERLLPKIETQLIPRAGHELPASKPETIDKRVLEFLGHPAMSN